MDNALTEAGKEHLAGYGLGAVGGRIGVGIVDKYQIQIRTMAQLDTPQLAVADNNKILSTATAVAAQRLAVARYQVAPRQLQYVLEDDFGDQRQIIAHLHQRQSLGGFGGGNTQHMGQPKIAQRVHMTLEVIPFQAQHLLTQSVAQGALVRHPVEPGDIVQLIQQHRVTGELVGDPGTGGTEYAQLLPRHLVLHQQHQIGGAAQHRLKQWQQALEQGARVFGPGSFRQHQRYKCVQPGAALFLHVAYFVAVPQGSQLRPNRFRRTVTLLPQPVEAILLRIFPQPQVVPFTADRIGFRLCFLGLDKSLKVSANSLSVLAENAMERWPIVKTHDYGDPQLVQFILGQSLGLLVALALDGVFGIAQEDIGRLELVHRRCRHIVALGNGVEHPQQ